MFFSIVVVLVELTVGVGMAFVIVVMSAYLAQDIISEVRFAAQESRNIIKPVRAPTKR